MAASTFAGPVDEPWSRIQTRMPAHLQQAVARDAARLGISQSEYVRAALVAHLAWHAALDAVENEHSTDDLRDPQTIARLLGENPMR